MRQAYSTITPGLIHEQARTALRGCLDWKAFGRRVGVSQLLDLLLLMAARTASLFATVRRFFSFSHETASKAVKANLPSERRLVAGLLNALYDVAHFSRLDRRRWWKLAIDTHLVGYYGQDVPGLVGGPKKQGTKRFFGYATAVLVHAQHRYTVALCPLQAKQKPHQIVQILLDQIAQKGLKIKGVALDTAFDGGETLLLLQERRLAYVVPLSRKGKGSNARNRCFEGRHNQIRWTEWTTEKSRRLVRTRTLLWKGRCKTRLFAFAGWSGGSAQSVYQQARQQRRDYRRRFGIETSYRQKNQAQARTTSRDSVYRLLLEGIAYLLRQVWVALTEQLACHRHARPYAWMADLTLELLLDWLAQQIRIYCSEKRHIPLDATS